MRAGPALPVGFEVVEAEGARVLVRPEAEGWVRYCLDRGRGLHGAAGDDRRASSLPGRYPVFVIPAKVSSDQDGPESPHAESTLWAVRHYARGGRVFPGLFGDRYLRLGQPRPYLEAQASEAVRRAGIPTPRVIAAAVYPQGVFYRADLVTAFVPGTTNLADNLFDAKRKGAGGAADRLDSLLAAGHLIQLMSREGVRHKDLNARNILLEWKGAAPRAHVLDLDRCDVDPGRSIDSTPMLRRLQRSLRKWESRTGLALSEKEWATLERASQGD